MNRRPLLAAGLAIIGAMLLASAWAWIKLPADAQVPIHFDASGQANGFAGRGWGLLLMPLIAIALLALLYFIPIAEPRGANLARSSGAYNAVCIAVMALLGVVQLLTVASALGWQFDASSVIFAFVGVLFMLIGLALPRVHSNYIFGIRTPWTLTSERSWAVTHRVGGWVFVIAGVVLAVAAFAIPASAIVWVLVPVIVAVAVIPTLVSYLVWREDPDRTHTPST